MRFIDTNSPGLANVPALGDVSSNYNCLDDWLEEQRGQAKQLLTSLRGTFDEEQHECADMKDDTGFTAFDSWISEKKAELPGVAVAQNKAPSQETIEKVVDREPTAMTDFNSWMRQQQQELAELERATSRTVIANVCDTSIDRIASDTSDCSRSCSTTNYEYRVGLKSVDAGSQSSATVENTSNDVPEESFSTSQDESERVNSCAKVSSSSHGTHVPRSPQVSCIGILKDATLTHEFESAAAVVPTRCDHSVTGNEVMSANVNPRKMNSQRYIGAAALLDIPGATPPNTITREQDAIASHEGSVKRFATRPSALQTQKAVEHSSDSFSCKLCSIM